MSDLPLIVLSFWNNEYMLSLSERVPRKPDCHLIACPQVGEVVLIKDKLPCGHSKMGKIFRIDCGGRWVQT